MGKNLSYKYGQNLLDSARKSTTDFTANLDRNGETIMFFIIKEAKETVSEFSQGTVKVL